jgi:hypothetical protein
MNSKLRATSDFLNMHKFKTQAQRKKELQERTLKRERDRKIRDTQFRKRIQSSTDIRIDINKSTKSSDSSEKDSQSIDSAVNVMRLKIMSLKVAIRMIRDSIQLIH